MMNRVLLLANTNISGSVQTWRCRRLGNGTRPFAKNLAEGYGAPTGSILLGNEFKAAAYLMNGSRKKSPD